MEIAEIEIRYKGKHNPDVVNSSLLAFNTFINNWDLNKIHFQEEMKMLLLNRANYPLGIYHISSGGMTGTLADMKLIMATALKSLASSIIIAHNHPSQNLKPSQMDVALTEKIKKACNIFDIQLHDHLIITEHKYFSFADENIQPF